MEDHDVMRLEGVLLTTDAQVLCVMNQVLDNFYDRALPLVPKGAIELQTHGSEIRFRNIYIKQLD